MDDGRRSWIARLVAASVVSVVTLFNVVVLELACAGGTEGSLMGLAALGSEIAGVLLAVEALTPLPPALARPQVSLGVPPDRSGIAPGNATLIFGGETVTVVSQPPRSRRAFSVGPVSATR